MPLAVWQWIWRRMVQVNLLGAAELCWAVARHPIDRGARGTVVDVNGASTCALDPFGAYAVAVADRELIAG